ncbi:MAG: hypothetical protein INQ03_17255 [Candidatus Heimdallarchaeota archaeon]|nr:hypothetical protein [Candidatus Heimdallarchaeota archaeon]
MIRKATSICVIFLLLPYLSNSAMFIQTNFYSIIQFQQIDTLCVIKEGSSDPFIIRSSDDTRLSLLESLTNTDLCHNFENFDFTSKAILVVQLSQYEEFYSLRNRGDTIHYFSMVTQNVIFVDYLGLWYRNTLIFEVSLEFTSIEEHIFQRPNPIEWTMFISIIWLVSLVFVIRRRKASMRSIR